MNLGFIGAGKIAGALAEGIAKNGAGQAIYISSRTAASRDALCSKVDAQRATNVEVATQADVIFLCVKPGSVAAVLHEIREVIEDKILVSVAAGFPLAKMRGTIGDVSVALIRAMPNTGSLVGKGATALCAETGVPEEVVKRVESLFELVGSTIQVPESMFDAVIGVSGSGPAFVYTFFEAMVDGGVLMGLPRATSAALALQTMDGAVAMLRSTGAHPAQLRDMITSPGGTTIAGLEALEKNGLRAAVLAAVRAAAEKSKSL